MTYEILMAFILFTFMMAANATLMTRTETISVGTTSTKVSDLERQRKYLLIQNNGQADLYVKLDSAHTGTEGIRIIPGGYWEPINPPINSVYMKSGFGSINVTILEGR